MIRRPPRSTRTDTLFPYTTLFRSSAADERADLATRPEQALIYRLSGDYNPLHADPAVAAAAGLDRPILHGLCTYGIAGRALLAALCGNDPARLRSEEHTSELQSLMRRSYAVFCLKHKTHIQHTDRTSTRIQLNKYGSY